MNINENAPASAAAEAFLDAPPQVVWEVQTDLIGWPEWNPDVAWIDLRGPVAPGTKFRWKAGGIPITSVLREVEPERRIAWTGQAPLGIRAVHTWSFEPEGAGTRVRTEESFDGVLVRLFAGVTRRMLAEALEKGLAVLKTEAERRVRAGASAASGGLT